MDDVPDIQDSGPLDLVPPDHTVPEGDNKSSIKYSEETDTHHQLAELLQQFWQFKDQFVSLKSATHAPTSMAELMQLTNILQPLTMTFQLHPAPQPNKEQLHKTMQAYMDILCTTQRETNLTMTMLQDIPTFNGQDWSKLEDWFIDIETSLTHWLIHEAIQEGNFWNEIKGVLRLKLCNANIYTYTSCFIEIQQKDNDASAAYIHSFKAVAKWCTFGNDTVAIHILLKDFGMYTPPHLKFMKSTLKLCLKSSDWCENSMQHNN